MGMLSWEESFANCDLGDKRRIKRAIKIANQIDSKCEKKGASAVLNGHGELKAASRLLNSSKVKPKSLIEGLGPTGNSEDQGFFIHPAIVVEPKKAELLGIAAMSVTVRPYGLKTTDREQHKKKDIIEKESYKWIEVPRQGIDRLPEPIKKTIVADREADIYNLFLAHQKDQLGKNTELLIRASRNRKISGGDKEYLYEEIESWKIKGTHTVLIEGTGTRKSRKAQCSIRFGQVTINVPKTQKHREEKEPVSDIFVVDIREEPIEELENQIHWILLTTWSVKTVEEAIEKIEWYRNRWIIEELFRVLKSGYQVESVRFNDGAALINWCALRLLMAVKLMYLRTHHNDEQPDSARSVFSEIELEVIAACEPMLVSAKSTIRRPEKNTTAWDSLLVAIMGGYQALPSAKPFGQTTLWRGLVCLEGAVIGYCAATQKSG